MLTRSHAHTLTHSHNSHAHTHKYTGTQACTLHKHTRKNARTHTLLIQAYTQKHPVHYILHTSIQAHRHAHYTSILVNTCAHTGTLPTARRQKRTRPSLRRHSGRPRCASETRPRLTRTPARSLRSAPRVAAGKGERTHPPRPSHGRRTWRTNATEPRDKVMQSRGPDGWPSVSFTRLFLNRSGDPFLRGKRLSNTGLCFFFFLQRVLRCEMCYVVCFGPF